MATDNGKIIMAWSKCKVEFGSTGENDAFAKVLTNVGKIRNQTTELSTNDGDALTEVATGGETVAMEQNDGTMQLKTTVIEPTPALYAALGIAQGEDTNGEQVIKTHIVPGDQSLKVTPRNKGARGIKAPVTRMTVAPAFDEQNGNALVITFNIVKTTAVAPTYKKKGASGWVATTTPTDISKALGIVGSDSELPADAKNDDVYGIDNNYWYSRFTTKSALH